MAWSRNIHWKDYMEAPEHFIDLYMKRLQMEIEKPSLDYLGRLVRANQQAIPFENLDITDFGKPVSLRPDRMTEKILVGGRGGFCFELNGLFSLLLKELGFASYLCICRLLRHSEDTDVPATHCAIVTVMDGKKYLCDVGSGGPVPSGCLLLEPDTEQCVNGKRYVIRQRDGWQSLVYIRKDKPPLPLFAFADVPFLLMDFYGNALMRSEGDSAYEVRHVSLRTDTGYADITGNRLTVNNGGKKTRRIFSNEELPELLRTCFHLPV